VEFRVLQASTTGGSGASSIQGCGHGSRGGRSIRGAAAMAARPATAGFASSSDAPPAVLPVSPLTRIWPALAQAKADGEGMPMEAARAGRCSAGAGAKLPPLLREGMRSTAGVHLFFRHEILLFHLLIPDADGEPCWS
jgi:hypothetical protein